MTPDSLAAAPRPALPRRGLAVALLFVPIGVLAGSDASVASAGSTSVADARQALVEARVARERAEAHAADLHHQLEVLDGRAAQLSASAEAITADLMRSRAALRATAVEAFLEHGRETELMLLLAADELTDASDRATLVGAGAGAAAADVGDYRRLRDDTAPALVRLADRRGRLEQQVREADDAAMQARAAEADAERAADAAEAADAAARQAETVRLAALVASPSVAGAPSAASDAEQGRQLDPASVQTVPPADLPPAPPGGPTDEQWAALRRCEAGGNYRAVSRSGRYRGAYQFDQRTWEAIGGRGDPAAASPAEQDVRAKLLYASRGSRPWPVCGQRLHR